MMKKCMVASAGLHLLLILVLLVGPAFFSKKPDPMPEIINLVDFTLTNEKTRGGGNPTVQEPPPPAPPVVEPPPPQPPPPEPESPKEVVRQPAPIPDPPKVVEPIKTKEPDIEVPKVVKTPPKTTPKPQIDLKPVTKTADKPAPQKVEPKPKPEMVFTPTKRTEVATKPTTQPKPDNSARIANDLKQIRTASQAIASKAASSTSVEVPGPGGQAFVNYRQLVASIYERAYDQALTRAGDIGDRDDSVDVAIVIASNGRVVSSRITRSSSNPALNKLVKGILDNVDSVPGFPPGSREAQQTFNIKFDLKSRRLTG